MSKNNEPKKANNIFKTMQKDATEQNLTDKDRAFIRSKEYNYGLRDGEHPIEGHGLLANLQRKFAPFTRVLRGIKYKLEDSSRRRRQIILSVLVGGMVLSAFIGIIWKKGLIVISTPTATAKQFTNGDTIQLVNKLYDEKTHTVRLDVQTSSPSGVLPDDKLTAEFNLLRKPKNPIKTPPELYLVPTFNNHFVVVVKNLYKGFGGIQIQFKNHSEISAPSLGSALAGGSNGIQKPKQNDDYKSAHFGAYELTTSQKETIIQAKPDPDGNDNDDSETNTNGVNNVGVQGRKITKDQLKIVNLVQAHNTQFLMYSESVLTKNKGALPSSVDPKEIAIDDLQGEINKLNNDITANQKMIDKSEPYVNSLRKKIKDLAKDADVDPDVKDKLQNTKQSISDAEKDSQDRYRKISLDKTWIDRYKTRIDGLKTGRVTIEHEEKPNVALNFKHRAKNDD